MKRYLLAVCLALTGCSYYAVPNDWHVAEANCAGNGGVKYFARTSFHMIQYVCNNGAEFTQSLSRESKP